ncbi:hypothetical protein L0663_20160 [Dyadobacter sp. CY107]|uniref:hypothetical protein n=1 Tax=Dyadobacter fanqingshengii TaxID=2906443 RepID=UPI001F3203FF|nr:hypothetical protein [Dyadobacter fanqingshengii]MCF2505720.1 hypothetical protein [Dyadobacter fanqingshengii]
MKTSEDKLNEALRAALKRKFDNFEDAPNPSAFEKIRAGLKPGPQWKYLFFTLLFVSIAIVGIVTDQHFRKKDIAKAAVSKVGVSKAAIAKLNVAKLNVAKLNVATSVSFENKKASGATFPSVSKDIKRSFSGIPNRKPKSNSVNPPLSETQSLTTVKDPGAEFNENANNLSAQPSVESATDNAIHFAVNEIDNQPFTLTSVDAGMPEINVPKTDIKPVVKTGVGNFNWLVNAAILQSYQILTVPSGAQSFQNFEFPSTFSLRSLGYKLSLGVEKKGFQLMLHYSHFQQTYSYEIAGNDYIVQTVDKDHFKVIRQGIRVSQDNNFRLIGVGLNKQISWGNAAVGKYYASAGLEYSYGTIRKQSIGWVNAGIGKQFPISTNASLHIGPYAEFSPVKFSGSGDPFYYQPYRVGISAGLRFNQ